MRSYREVFAHLAVELAGVKDGMISANTVHLGQLALIVDFKERRDDRNSTLFRRFLKARHTLEALFGSDKRFPVLAITGDTPDDPTGLVAQVRETVGFRGIPKWRRRSSTSTGSRWIRPPWRPSWLR